MRHLRGWPLFLRTRRYFDHWRSGFNSLNSPCLPLNTARVKLHSECILGLVEGCLFPIGQNLLLGGGEPWLILKSGNGGLPLEWFGILLDLHWHIKVTVTQPSWISEQGGSPSVSVNTRHSWGGYLWHYWVLCFWDHLQSPLLPHHCHFTLKSLLKIHNTTFILFYY